MNENGNPNETVEEGAGPTPERNPQDWVPRSRLNEVIRERNELREGLEAMSEHIAVRYADALDQAGVTEEDLNLLIAQRALGTPTQQREAREELKDLDLPDAVKAQLDTLAKELKAIKDKDVERETREKQQEAASRLATQDANIERFKKTHGEKSDDYIRPHGPMWNKVASLVDMMEKATGELVDPEDALQFLRDEAKDPVDEAKAAETTRRNATAAVTPASRGRKAEETDDIPDNLTGKALEKAIADKWARRRGR